MAPARAEALHTSYLHAFYPSYTDYNQEMEKYIDQLDCVSFAWSRMDYTNDVWINSTKGLNGNKGFYYPADYLSPIRYAKSKNKPIQLNIFSNKSSAEAILTNEANRNKAINLIVEQMTQNIANAAVIAPTSSPSPSVTPTPAINPTPGPSITPSPTNDTVPTPTPSESTSTTPQPEVYTYDGVVIDFEGLKNTNSDRTSLLFDGKPVSQYLNLFLQDLRRQLSAINKTLYVAVNVSDFYDGYDYKTIASIADHMILMAHDYEPVTALKKSEARQYYEYDVISPTKSTAPANDVKRAINDVRNKLASSALCKKVILQLAFDSAQWQYQLENVNEWDALDSNTSSMDIKQTPTYEKIKSRIDNIDGTAENIVHGYNNLMECPYMTYYNPTEKLFNVVVYENAKSMSSKIRHAANAGFGGLSLWALGNIPDYSDKSGLALNLNVWSTILQLSDNASLWNGNAQSAPKGPSVKFADKKIEVFIRGVINKPIGSIYQNDLLEIDRLKLPPNTTSKLSDLKNLKNLEFLDVSENAISDLTPLGTLVNLKALYLSRNKIKDLRPLAKLKGLEVISLKENNITDLSPLAGLTKLRRIYLTGNKITSIKPFARLVNLRELYIGKNLVSDINALKDMKYLYDLNAESNKIAEIKVLASLPGLRYLNLKKNNIKDTNPLKGLKFEYKL